VISLTPPDVGAAFFASRPSRCLITVANMPRLPESSSYTRARWDRHEFLAEAELLAQAGAVSLLLDASPMRPKAFQS
jgi:hypothetical protein